MCPEGPAAASRGRPGTRGKTVEAPPADVVKRRIWKTLQHRPRAIVERMTYMRGFHTAPVKKDDDLWFQTGTTEHKNGSPTRYMTINEALESPEREKFLKLSHFLQKKYPKTKYCISWHKTEYGRIYYAVDAVDEGKGKNFLCMRIDGKRGGCRKCAYTEDLKDLIDDLFEGCCFDRQKFKGDRPIV